MKSSLFFLTSLISSPLRAVGGLCQNTRHLLGGDWKVRINKARAMKHRSIFIFGLGFLLTAGCTSTTQQAVALEPGLMTARFFLETNAEIYGRVILAQSGVEIHVAPKPVFTEFDVADVQVAQVELGKCLMFRFTPAATRDLYRLTRQHVGSRLVLFLDAAPVGARHIEQPLAEGMLLIFVATPDSALPVLAANLRKTCAAIQHHTSNRQ